MPRVKTTPMVRIALWALRIYLLILLSLIGLKFSRMYSKAKSETNTTPRRPAEELPRTGQ